MDRPGPVRGCLARPAPMLQTIGRGRSVKPARYCKRREASSRFEQQPSFASRRRSATNGRIFTHAALPRVGVYDRMAPYVVSAIKASNVHVNKHLRRNIKLASVVIKTLSIDSPIPGREKFITMQTRICPFWTENLVANISGQRYVLASGV